jgi:hypothetical protein
MKQLTVIGVSCLLFFSACKKDKDDPGTVYAAPDPNAIVATPPPPGFTFPKTFKESSRVEEFKIWVKGVDKSAQIQSSTIFEAHEWIKSDITLIDRNTLEFYGGLYRTGYFFYKDGLYLIDQGDTTPFPVCLGNYTQIEQYNYEIKLSSGGASSRRDVFTKSTKASLMKDAEDEHMTPVDTMAYINSSLIMK